MPQNSFSRAQGGENQEGASPGRRRPGDVFLPYASPGLGIVVVDSMPLFRAGAIAALSAAGPRACLLGETSRLDRGVQLAWETGAEVLLVGGFPPEHVAEAVAALPGCAVVALMTHAVRSEIVDMLRAGVAGLALRSINSEELMATLEAAARPAGSPDLGGGPVLMPLPLGTVPPAGAPARRDGLEVAQLTHKEREILGHLATGASNKKMAEAMYVTPATIKTHLAHIYAKLGVGGRHEALARAVASGLLR